MITFDIQLHMRNSKPNLIILSYYEPGSGFFTVISNIAPALQQHFAIHYLGIGYHGDIRQEKYWTLYPGKMDIDDFAAKSCCALAQELYSGTILIINDLWVNRIYEPHLSSLKGNWKIIAYAPVDGHVLDKSIVCSAVFLDKLVVYTEFARAEIERIQNELHSSSPAITYPPVTIIPHGVDSAFYKMNDADKKTARAALFKNEDWQNSFIILNANKISERKRVDLTIKAFHLFSQEKPDVRLYLHDSHITPEYHARLTKKLADLDLSEKVLITPAQSITMNKDWLNMLYNACDVGINTSVGEGWGLVSFEHAATGAAQIVPGHSACEELWKDNAEIIPIKGNYQIKDRPDTLMKEVDVSKAADALNKLYVNKEYMQLMEGAAYVLARSEDFKWKNIGTRWLKSLQKTNQ